MHIKKEISKLNDYESSIGDKYTETESEIEPYNKPENFSNIHETSVIEGIDILGDMKRAFEKPITST